MQNKLIREETTGINRVAMPYPVPQGWNDNKGYVKTKVTEDGAQVVKQSEPIFYRSPQTEIVFNEVVEGNGQYLVLFEGNIPENTQSIGVSFRKNSQTSVTTEFAFKQGDTVIRYEVSDWTNEFKAIYPVIGDGLRVRIREMASTTQPLIIALSSYYTPQTKE